ncbi:F-box domain, FBD domain, Leucine-rich repeat domain, L domain-like protein [Artemisia annua]|uniref:F-box domain, FBD domain, Leucine-rich repeat domain, L domain-like protein n=1 Tax=Artemisia annua TaxID=35608 RepID=A0A2U1KKU1_ARTAN|nr:F-box domain, FBD domain, Leucine-rich repeat domain, L domain-like protein [Artemisia annua]
MTSQSKKMKVQCLNSDRISSLPQDITENILTRMPIRDAIRTSILSRKWRSSWKSMTKLFFNDKMVNVPCNCQKLKKYKLRSAILNVLLLHTGSILDIKIEVGELDVDSEFDQIIRYLSRNNSLQKFRFLGSLKHCYKLPSSFLSLQGLEFIFLGNCIFRHPIRFDGFSKLRGVVFGNVDITSKTLQLFLSKCPLLRHLALIGGSRYFARGSKLTFVELLQCVPLIEFLEIRGPYVEYLSAGGMPHELATSLVKLKCLYLGVCFDVADELSSALCLIRSSPNLEELGLMGYDKSDTAQISKNLPDIHDYSGFTLDHLDVFWMEKFANKDREVEFLKLIMAMSPLLKKAQIELDKSVSLDEENKMLRNLLQLPFQRASPSAKLIIERPKPSSR